MSEDLTTFDELPADHRSGYVSLVGRPNTGKSTLLNALLGQKVAIVSDKPQTTRNAIIGILTRPEAQVIFLDTPGLHRPLHKLGEFMVETAKRTLHDADLVCLVVDVSTPPSGEEQQVVESLSEAGVEDAILVLNKADLVDAQTLAAHAAQYRALTRFVEEIAVSAVRQQNLDRLLQAIIARLPPGPRYYSEEMVTDQYERFIAAELVREQVMRRLRQEVPYGVAVLVDRFAERPDGLVHIEATIYVDKESHKGIIIGRGGSMLKQIGQAARQEIERMLEARVFLELWVKARPAWRKREDDLRRFGYSLRE